MLKWIRKQIRTAQDSAIVRQIVGWRAGVPHKPAHGDIRNLARWLQSWVFICIDRNATEVAQGQPQLLRREDTKARATRRLRPDEKRFYAKSYQNDWTDDAVVVEDHPFIDLLANPNPILDGTGLLWLTAASLQAMGDAYWHISFDNDGMPNEIWPLPSQLVYPILGRKRVYDEYEFRVGGMIQRFAAEEIVHFRKPSLVDTISAMGNLRGIIEAAETNTKMLEFERAIFENMAVPDILLVPQGNTTPDQVESLRVQWQEKFRGWLRRGSVGAAPYDLKVERIGLTMRELQHKETRMAVVEEICAGHGVPLPIVRVDGTTFNNMHNGMLLWARHTVLPLQRKIADTVNCRLMAYYMPRGVFETGGAPVPARPQYWMAFPNPVPDDEQALVTQAATRLQAGQTTINEERAKCGDDPVEWGEEPWLPSGVMQPTATQAQLEFDRSMAEAEVQRQQDEFTATTEAATQPIPPTFTEMTTAMQLFANNNDVEAYNLIRQRFAASLGGTLPDVDEIRPSMTSGIVNPEEAAQFDEEQGEGDAAQGEDEGEGGPQGTQQDDEGDEDEEGEDGKGNTQLAAIKRHNHSDEKVQRLELAERRAVQLYDTFHARKFALEPGGAAETTAADSMARKLADVYARFIQDIITSASATLTQLGDISTLRMFGDTDAKRTALQKDLTRDMVQAIVKMDRWKEEIKVAALPYLSLAMKHGAALGQADLVGRIDTVMPIDPTDIIKAAERLASSFASVTVNTTGDEVASIIGSALTRGLGADEVTKQLAGLHDAKKKTAQVIARTELNNAMNFAASETWRTNGVDEHEWFAAPDSCEFCDALDGKVVAIGKPFVKQGATLRGTEGGTYHSNYKTVTHPTLHPRCRCSLLPVV